VEGQLADGGGNRSGIGTEAAEDEGKPSVEKMNRLLYLKSLPKELKDSLPTVKQIEKELRDGE